MSSTSNNNGLASQLMLGLIMYINDTFNYLPYLVKHITDLATDENPVILVKVDAR